MAPLLAACAAPVRGMARDLGRSARRALWRGVLAGLAGLIGLAGTGFLLLAAYAGLSTALGPGFAALAMGGGLLCLAALLLWVATKPRKAPPRRAPDRLQRAPLGPDTMAVFTMAVMVGRLLAQRT